MPLTALLPRLAADGSLGAHRWTRRILLVVALLTAVGLAWMAALTLAR